MIKRRKATSRPVKVEEKAPEPAAEASGEVRGEVVGVEIDEKDLHRQRLARIIEHRILQTPVPSDLAFHDNLMFTNGRRVAEIKAVMVREGAGLDQAYAYALRSVQ